MMMKYQALLDYQEKKLWNEICKQEKAWIFVKLFRMLFRQVDQIVELKV